MATDEPPRTCIRCRGPILESDLLTQQLGVFIHVRCWVVVSGAERLRESMARIHVSHQRIERSHARIARTFHPAQAPPFVRASSAGPVWPPWRA
jgi:hypothetical protein